MKLLSAIVWLAILLAGVGCTGNIETTDDSTKIETEVPKVEVGAETLDLDPRTDDDIDIDTPLPGDN
jgi:hypothetical protein